MELSTRTRRALSTVLAVILAVETVSAVAAAASTRTVTHDIPDAPPAGAVLAVEATPAAVAGPADAPVVIVPDSPADDARDIKPFAVAPVVRAPEREAVPDKPAKVAKADKAAKGSASTKSTSSGGSKSSKASTSKSSPKPASYKGTNHVWIPSLGISRSVRWFPCDRSRPPDNYMYRWGCAGENNVYLMGHAYSVMKPLHDAYVSGRLRVGMKAHYAGADGKVRTYVVKWWKKTRPTTDAAWAWAPQDVPSMTLQTCVGKNSEYRLMVRLVVVRG
jgi:hypothetical protein